MGKKYLKEVELEQKKFLIFAFNWTGSRVPEFIIFPDSKKIKVSNMRNNKIILENGTTGTYTRWMDNNKTNERAIIINLEIE